MLSSTQNVARTIWRRPIFIPSITSLPSSSNVSLNHDSCPKVVNSHVANAKHFSTPSSGSSKGFIDRMKDKIDERSQKNQANKYAEQIRTMAESEQWDLKSFGDEIEKSTSNWRNKIPGMSNVEQVKAIKENQKLINSLMDEIGENATAKELGQLGRREKLMISLRSNVSVEAINMIIQQFQGMDVMHRILRYRKENGLSIPTSEKEMHMAMQSDGDKVMSKKEKREIQTARAQKSFRGHR